MDFIKFRDKIADNFLKMTENVTHLFEVEIDKDEFWNLYLDSFPAGTNEIYIKRREHDCSCCRHFIKAFGNVVVIKDNNIHTIWDVDTGSSTFQPVADALAAYIKSHKVTDVYVTKEHCIGVKHNHASVERNGKLTAVTFNHFHIELPNKFFTDSYKSVERIRGEFRDIKNVFRRSLAEISVDSLDTVLELIRSNTLYRGNEWKNVLETFLVYKKAYDTLTNDVQRDLFAWENSIKAGAVIGKLRNHSIGTLLIDISEGKDLDEAVTAYERIVAPENYKRPKAIFTQRMLDEAKETITSMGYLDSLQRRYAVLDDITVNNILFANKDSAKHIAGAEDVFAEMAKSVSAKPKKFSRLEEVSAENFIKNILPTASDVEVYFENKHIANMVSLIAPAIAGSKTMFKWNNNFSWSYTGNMTDSMKERVKAAGGKVDGDLRFSIQWNDIDTGMDNNDLDAHCITPNGFEIYYRDKRDHITGGNLDVDIIEPKNKVAVENITWANRNKMTAGVYKFFVHQFTNRGGKNGFRAEIEFDGQIYSFDYPHELRQDEKVYVAEVTLDKNGKFSIKELLPSSISSREIWGINSNHFIPVSVICYSPNYWDEQNGNGNKHLFFMLKDCVNPETPNGFFNEFLKEELMEHKRVFEALGSKMRVKDTDNQLSGIGFCLTKRNELIVKVKGSTERVIKVKF